MSLGSIARELSKLERFEKPKLSLEQYPTPGEIAAQLVWSALLQGDIEDKNVVDLGAGTGVLGIGALLAGAAHVTFVEKDPDAIAVLLRNLEGFDPDHYTIIEADATTFAGTFDTAIMNPPFGAQVKHADKAFLLNSFRIASVTYSIHNANSKGFLTSLMEDEKRRMYVIDERELRLDHAFAHHTKRVVEQRVLIVQLRGPSR